MSQPRKARRYRSDRRRADAERTRRRIVEAARSLFARDRWFGVAIVALTINMTTSVNMAVVVYGNELSSAVYWAEIGLFAYLLAVTAAALAVIKTQATRIYSDRP